MGNLVGLPMFKFVMEGKVLKMNGAWFDSPTWHDTNMEKENLYELYYTNQKPINQTYNHVATNKTLEKGHNSLSI